MNSMDLKERLCEFYENEARSCSTVLNHFTYNVCGVAVSQLKILLKC